MQLDLAPTSDPAADAPKPVRIEAASPGCTLARPKERDDGIVRMAAERLAPRCVEWDEPGASPEDWVEALVRAAHDWDDGYRLARVLERRSHVDPDELLVGILGDAAHVRSDVHRAEVVKWVRIVGFDPAHAVGDAVGTRWGDGVVVDVRVETAQYVVSTDGRTNGGHVIDAEAILPTTATATSEPA